MGSKQLTITRQVFGKDLIGYQGYKLYIAREPDFGYMGRGGPIYFLTRETYRSDEKIWVDYDDETVPLIGHPSGKMDNMDIFVHRPKHVTMSDHFKVKAMIPATEPYEHFRNQTIRRSEYMLFLAERPASHGYRPDLCKVFSKVLYMKGEDIPFNETSRLHVINASEKANYYIHDKAMYDRRAHAALRAMVGRG